MKKELIELYQNGEISLSYRAIKRFLGVSKKHIDEELKELLINLELEGILYEDRNGLYKSVPSNFFVAELRSNKKNSRYVEYDARKYFIDNKDLNGALIFDKILVSKQEGNVRVEKIIKRNLPNVVCEVVVKDNRKTVKPLNLDNNLQIVLTTKSMKKLVDGERVLVKGSNRLFDVNYSKENAIYKYEGEIIKSIGHRNDPDIDYKTVAYNHGFNLEFPKEVMDEADKIPSEVLKEEIEGRVDLRNWRTYTLDDVSCKDMDDAVSIKRIESGYILGVHIAHVSHYVKMGSHLFNEALERTTSVYFPDSSIPMLPHKLSDGICSLNEGVDRLTRSFIIEFDNIGNIVDYKIVKGVIHSDKKMNYDAVESILTNKEIPEGYENFVEDLKIMKELSDKLTIIKNNRGYISFDSDEIKFDLDRLGNTKNINVKERKSSEELIENFMLIPNHLVTEYIGLRPCVYRNHPVPSAFRIKDTLLLFKDLGYKLENFNSMSSNMLIQKLLNMFKDKEEFIILSNLILRSMKLAYYGVENEGHFGLSLEDGYSHFTSPIRRLADLLLHTLLDIYDERELDIEETNKMIEFLSLACEKASKMERMSEKAEYEIDKVQIVNYVKQHIGSHVEAFIEKINADHIIVRSKGLMDGVVFLEDFDDKVYMLPSGKLKSAITGRVYKIGHKLELEIKDASYSDKTIYYRMIDNLTLSEVDEKKLQRLNTSM